MKKKTNAEARVIVGIDRKYWTVLQALKARDGVTIRWQVEHAIALLAAEKGLAIRLGEGK